MHPPDRVVIAGYVVTALLALVIGVLTLTPMPEMPGRAGMDKVYHALAFAALAFPLSLVRPRLAFWVALGVVAYGGAIEVIQPFVGRHAEWADLLADGIGALLGAGAGGLMSGGLSRLRHRKNA